MTEKRCTDCKHTKGIGYDFWCGEGHSEYEVFGAETNCPYFEYHDWSKGIPMTKKRFKTNEVGCIVDYEDNLKNYDGQEIVDLLNELHDENNKLKKENGGLKQELYDCKEDEKQLSISFMDYKMQLIEVLQQNYNYAYNQRQKNLDDSIVARTYEVLYQTIYNIAETMNVDIERFPKGDGGYG